MLLESTTVPTRAVETADAKDEDDKADEILDAKSVGEDAQGTPASEATTENETVYVSASLRRCFPSSESR